MHKTTEKQPASFFFVLGGTSFFILAAVLMKHSVKGYQARLHPSIW